MDISQQRTLLTWLLWALIPANILGCGIYDALRRDAEGKRWLYFFAGFVRCAHMWLLVGTGLFAASWIREAIEREWGRSPTAWFPICLVVAIALVKAWPIIHKRLRKAGYVTSEDRIRAVEHAKLQAHEDDMRFLGR